MSEKKITAINQCGREITVQEIEEIKEMISVFCRLSRIELAQTIAENLQWYSASGTNKIDACLKLLEKLELQGILQLPEKQTELTPRVKKKLAITEKTALQPEIVCKLKELGPVELEIVKDRNIVALWNEYVERYHYLGYKKPFGYTMRYFIKSERGRIGCVLFCGASKAMRIRDYWIGWTETQRLRNLAWVINNARFLIFPWVKVKNLASHALGRINRQIRFQWKESWGYSPVLMETFVDPANYQGTCYKAANWQCLGMTTGQGLVRKGKSYTTSPKKLFVKPLVKNYREQLCSEQLAGRIL